jgi:monothiol glutaredoxin
MSVFSVELTPANRCPTMRRKNLLWPPPKSEVGKFICVRAIMTRNILDEAHIHPAIRKTIANHHADTVSEVRAAVAANDVVVVGMKQNPFPKKARKALDAAGIAYKYLTFGSYLGGWRSRGALRMWTGWPTFPMVFVKGVLVGGADDLNRLIASGELTRMLAGKPGPRRKK